MKARTLTLSPFLLAIIFLGLLLAVPAWRLYADDIPEAPLGRDATSPRSAVSEPVPGPAIIPGISSLYLPLVFVAPPKLSDRLGFNSSGGPITRYPELASLKAGWYVDWNTQMSPAQPGGIEYVQTIRLHQKLSCPSTSPNRHDRVLCPYLVPHDYDVFPSRDTIAAIAVENHGALWLVGNEMDRRDWDGGNQDEMLPELYAVAYRDLYTLIKSVDPFAKVAIGGVIQATPLRLEYLTKAWDRYQVLYGEPMPVDVWNVHNFILKEKRGDYGAEIPPGSNAITGAEYEDKAHIDMAIFHNQIKAFRQWMKERGQQNKPLIVSEYGVLYSHAGLDDQYKVETFMLSTFDYFLNTRDCNLGQPSDGCRLVQRWNWYSLDDSQFNVYGQLFNPSTRQMTPTGIKFRDWSLNNIDLLRY